MDFKHETATEHSFSVFIEVWKANQNDQGSYFYYCLLYFIL